MAVIQVYCPTCSGDNVVKYGMSEQGKQRYYCKNLTCDKKIFLLDYHKKAWVPGVKEKIINMAMNGSGIRDTSRVLGVHRDTVMSTLKKSASARKRQ
jgi:transposase-like protein